MAARDGMDLVVDRVRVTDEFEMSPEDEAVLANLMVYLEESIAPQFRSLGSVVSMTCFAMGMNVASKHPEWAQYVLGILDAPERGASADNIVRAVPIGAQDNE